MDSKEIEVADKQNVFATAFKYVMSLLLLTQLINYATTGSKVGKWLISQNLTLSLTGAASV